ncbi:DUF6461 domain-containing protein [Actinoplanes sp. DH11]|uniref:DUF6461 domain-containing protein n=1 Tax=Actinoplanes sp. DH11 TaxID=2857011 RepID=UPI001E5254D5|nr:DUF6461 domain-containing protein [Actinoplanes sp. DH11]
MVAVSADDYASFDYAGSDHAGSDHARSDHARSDHARSDHARSDHAGSDHARFDYAWFTEQCAELAEACCLTLVRDRTPADVITHLGGTDPARAVGLRRLTEQTGTEFVAATTINNWTLIVGPEIEARRLSRGTTLVSHSGERFVWARDGEILLEFDPADPAHRSGSDPDGILTVLERLGFDIPADNTETADPNWTSDARQRERAMALAEQLTGVRLTLQLLESASFKHTPLPPPANSAPTLNAPAQPGLAQGALAQLGRAQGAPAQSRSAHDASAAPVPARASSLVAAPSVPVLSVPAPSLPTAAVQSPSTGRPAAEAHRAGTRSQGWPERWDEEYDAPDDEWSDSDSDEDGDTDTDDREWPRLIAKVRKAFR